MSRKTISFARLSCLVLSCFLVFGFTYKITQSIVWARTGLAGIIVAITDEKVLNVPDSLRDWRAFRRGEPVRVLNSDSQDSFVRYGREGCLVKVGDRLSVVGVQNGEALVSYVHVRPDIFYYSTGGNDVTIEQFQDIQVCVTGTLFLMSESQLLLIKRKSEFFADSTARIAIQVALERSRLRRAAVSIMAGRR